MPKELSIPQPIAAFIEATNKHDTNEVLVTLTERAVFIDEGTEYRGIAAIKEWSDEKLIGARVTLEAFDVIDRDGKTIVTTEVDGNFDKTGLPNPFYLDFHFIVDGNKIAALNIRLAGE